MTGASDSQANMRRAAALLRKRDAGNNLYTKVAVERKLKQVQQELPGAPATTDVFVDAGGIDDAAKEFAQIHSGGGASQIIGMNEGFCKLYDGATGGALSDIRWHFSKAFRVPPGVWVLAPGGGGLKFHRLVQDKDLNYSPDPVRTFPMLDGKSGLTELIRADQALAFKQAVDSQLPGPFIFLVVPSVPSEFLAPPKPSGSGAKAGRGKRSSDKTRQGKGTGDKSGAGKGGKGDPGGSKEGTGSDERDRAGSTAGQDGGGQGGVPNGSERDTIDREAKEGGVKIIGDALPARIEGLDLQSTGGQGDYEVKLEYTAAGADLLSQVAAAMAAYHYHWEMLDITRAVGAEARAKAEAAARTAKQGSGSQITGDDVAAREMKTAGKETLEDDAHVFQDMAHLHPSALVNYELMPITNLVELAGASIAAVGDYLSEDIDSSTKIPWPQEEGYYLLRSLVVPPVVETKDGTRQRLPTSVATKIVEVRSPDYLLKNAAEAADADVHQAQADLKKAQASQDPTKIKEAEQAVKDASLKSGGDAADWLRRQIEIVTKQRDEARQAGQNAAVKDLDDELKSLNDRLHMAGDRAKRGTSFRPQAVLVSNVTGQTYPLLFQLIKTGPGAWTLSDLTSDTGNVKSETGSVDRDVVHKLFDEFGRDAPWGRGTITVKVPAGVCGPAEQWTVESAPRDVAQAKRSIEDLTKVLVLLGLFVPGAGEAAAIVGGVMAGAHLVERFLNGNLHADVSAADDVLAVVIAATTHLQMSSELRVIRSENRFAIALNGASDDAINEAKKALDAATSTAALTARINSIAGNAFLAWGTIEGIDRMIQVNSDEENGKLTHSEARKARADFVISMLQNGAMVMAPGLAAKHKEQVTAEEAKAKPTDASKAASENRRAAEAPRRFDNVPELRTGLPEDLASSLAITVDSSSDFGAHSVHVEYTAEAGLIKDIRLRVGPEVKAKEIAEHVGTVTSMRRYEGLSGRLRALLERIRAWFKSNPMAGPGTRAWEARLELQKLPAIIESHAREMADPATLLERRAALEHEIDDLESQLARHAADVDSVEAGQGFVAAEGKTGAADSTDAAQPKESKEEIPFVDRPDVKKGFADADKEHQASGAEGPSPSARFDAAMQVLKQHGLDNPGLREIEKMFNPGQGQEALSGDRLLRSLGRLETLADLVKERPDVLKPEMRADWFKSIEELAEKVEEAYRHGQTLDGRGISTPQSPELAAGMARMKAEVEAYRQSSGDDPIERLMALERVRRQVMEVGQEFLRSYGEGFTARPELGDVSASSTLVGTRQRTISVSASGKIYEPLNRRLPGMGLERYMLTPGAIAKLKTVPPGVGRRLAERLGWSSEDGGRRAFHRAHLVGPGFGSELFEGMMLAPPDVNLRAQNNGVEELIRIMGAAGREVTLDVKATGTRYVLDLEGGGTEEVDVLSQVEYRIHEEGKADKHVVITVKEDGTAALNQEGKELLDKLEDEKAKVVTMR